jgi:hypothetical protein
VAIKNLRILPPLAVARLGSSPDPMENFDLESPDAASPRQIVPARSLYIDEMGHVTERQNQAVVSFRDKDGLIRPIAPFFEVWIQQGDSDEWIPLTKNLLAACGLGPEALQWSLHVANNKIHRRTNDPNDRIDGIVSPFGDHSRHAVLGRCKNFLDGESIPLGSIQYARPSDAHPEIRARFIPAHGKVYGAKTEQPDPNITKPVYDPTKGNWTRYQESGSPNNDFAGRSLTNPNQIFAGYDIDTTHVSYGYVDDECDGIVDVRLNIGGQTLTSFARVAAGPPTFAPDSKPVRTVADELEQALLGPDAPASDEEVLAVKDLVRRALETVRLMHTGQLNKGGKTRGVGMARMDILDVARKSEPIFDPTVADPLAIRARHERVLLALESGSLAWFARVLRDYDKVGDLSDEGRRKMPAMMRNADGRHLALTRRQVAKVRRVAEYIVSRGARPQALPDDAEIRPVNLAAQLQYRAKGNPPSTRPDTAISNAYPGLEMDFRNAWRRILDGIVLHESLNFVLDTDRAEHAALKGMLLLTVDGVEVTAQVTGPNIDGTPGPLTDSSFGSDRMALEWSNALASVVHTQSGKEVECVFQSLDGKNRLTRRLKVRHFFEPGTSVIARDIAEPGALTQSLCAPWQNDYRECACFYWAANRPDFVNVEVGTNGSSAGHNWMQKDRTSSTAKVYISDDWLDGRLLSHTDLIRNWEKALRFIIANQDEPPIA